MEIKITYRINRGANNEKYKIQLCNISKSKNNMYK